jgi:cytochrome c oxidase subunit 2
MWRWQKGASICAVLGASVVLLVAIAASAPVSAQAQGSTRSFAIAGSQYAFRPSTITVDRNDLVKITFSAEDIAHSFTVDAYRISKRAGAGQSVTFEFRADQPGTFDYYCNLSIDAKCKSMRGRLTVK